jgi:hypothetical protein
MLTLEQVREGQKLVYDWTKYNAQRPMDTFAPELVDWFLEHHEALLDAAERVARDELDQTRGDVNRRRERIRRGLASRDDLILEELAREARASARLDGETHCVEDDATFARNELAAGERLTSLQKPDDAPKGEPEKPR